MKKSLSLIETLIMINNIIIIISGLIDAIRELSVW